MSITSDKFVCALINTFKYDKHVNIEHKNKIFMFSPHRFKPVFINIFLQFLVSITVLIFFPFLPLVKKLKNIGFDKNNKNEMLIVSSEKSYKLFDENLFTKNNYDVIYTSEQSADNSRFNWNLKSYYIYICACINFFKYFKLNLWFYPAVLQIPKMVTFTSYLEFRKPTRVIFTNHYDRWTYLIIQYCEIFNAESILIQHGILDDSLDFSAVKYKKLSKIFCYDESQYDIFIKYFYESIVTRQFFKPKINLSPIERTPKSILIVGHGDPRVVSIENDVANWLLCNTSYMIYIKPHPVFKNNSFLYKINVDERCILISDSGFYPDVDYLLHSGSTLAEEYRNCSSKIKILSLNEFKQCL